MATNSVNCNLCGSDEYKVVYDSNIGSRLPEVREYTSTTSAYGSFNRLVLCSRCGLIYQNPRDRDVVRLYQDVTDHAYIDSWENRALTFRRLLGVLRNHIRKGGDVLDIGCYAGIFIDEAKKSGYRMTGIEPSVWAANYAAKRTGAAILQGGWSEASLPENSFDAVTIWDVVEHLEDPAACFRQAHKWLKKDGVLVISTHDIKSLFARIAGRRYPWLMRFHLYHFEPRTILLMLTANGFKPVLLKHFAKTFSLKYMLGQLGLNVGGNLFKRIPITVNSADTFFVVAKKSIDPNRQGVS